KTAGALHGVGPLVDDAVGRGGGGGRVGVVVPDKFVDEGLPARVTKMKRHVPGPGGGADHALHDCRADLVDHAQGQVRHGDLHAFGQPQFIGEPHGFHHLVTEQHQHQDVSVAGGGSVHGGFQFAIVKARERHHDLRVRRDVGGVGELPHGSFGGGAPGVVGGAVEIY